MMWTTFLLVPMELDGVNLDCLQFDLQHHCLDLSNRRINMLQQAQGYYTDVNLN